MMSIAYPLTRAEREAVASELGKGSDEAALPASAMCDARRAILAGNTRAGWTGWSPAPTNTRFQPPAAAGLRAADVPRLELKWAFAFPGDVTAFAAPTVARAARCSSAAPPARCRPSTRRPAACTGSIQANGPVRAAMTVAGDGDNRALVFSDQNGWVYSVDARTGSGQLDDPRRSARGDAADRFVRRARRPRVRAGGVVGGNPLDRSRRTSAAPSAAASPLFACATGRSRGRPIWWTSRARPGRRRRAPTRSARRARACGRRRPSMPRAACST